MPNQPRHPTHSYRCSEELYEAAMREAADRGEVLTDAIVKFLERYVRRTD